ncbi:N-acetylmuramoyl-L-alanine amidase family protein [Shouchella shacheensis]|uniref:N-acetylmuramoyl-L-alanine amidase family protein n=1 Tax=Shouchella shacheensis TaxID=1649580 RepID=UPI000740209F|nr:N-acetylmuramoyl-L-alanine amidase [Shouchella shacheensis]
MTRPKIILDAGHGGRDPGAVGHGLREKDLVLAIAKEVEKRLTNYECDTRMTRSTDIFVALSERARIANSWGANVFVSIHVNAGGGTGVETFIHPVTPQATIRFQSAMHRGIVGQLANVRDRGRKTANFAVLRETKMSAVLTENLFIDHAQDARLLKSTSTINAISQGHVDGLIAHFKLKPKTQTSSPSSLYRLRIDGTQVGAFKQGANVLKNVEAHLGTAKRIEVTRG